MINLIEEAPRARWTAISRNILGNQPPVALSWGGGRDDPNGFVNLWPSSRSEDNVVGDYLATRTPSTVRGSIIGVFPRMRMPSNAVFRGEVGFLFQTPNGSGAVFEVWVHYEHEGRALTHRVSTLYKVRNGAKTNVEVDLSFLSGRDATIELRVESGLRPNGYAIPAWSALRVEERETALAAPTRFVEIRPTQLTVNDRTERSGGGDDPFLAVLYMRSTLGVPGSTMVEVLDLLGLLAEDVDTGSSIQISDRSAMVVRDVGLQSGNMATLMITSYVALEEDRRGRAEIREMLRDAAKRVAFYLVQTVESNPSEVLNDAESFLTGLQAAASGAPSSGGFGTAFLEWIGRAHDLVGINALTLVVGPLASAIPTAPDRRRQPVSTLENRDFLLDFSGDGGHWTLGVEVRTVEPNQILSGNPTLQTVDPSDVGL